MVSNAQSSLYYVRLWRFQRVLSPPLASKQREEAPQVGQIVAEVNRSREELARLKMALRQGFILIDETCAEHSSALEGLQSFAGAEIGANQSIHKTLQRLSSQWEHSNIER